MNEWKEVILQAVVIKLGDGLHGTPKYDDNGEYYFVNGNNLSNGKIIGGGYMLTDEKGNDKVKAKIETKEKI